MSLTDRDYKWEPSRNPNMVVLSVRSVNDGKWKKYYLNDEWCSCPCPKFCYHREALQMQGGVSSIQRVLQRRKEKISA